MRGEPTKLLWTGGWDSTFRLLDLVLNQGRQVRPYYVLDHKRPSTPLERAVQARIRDTLAARHPGASRLVLEAREFDMDTIAQKTEITCAYERLARLSPLGTQYDWLARLALEHGLSGVELAIHRDDRAVGIIQHIDGTVTPDMDAMVMAHDAPADHLAVLGAFRFPLLHLTKRDMAEIARESGFLDILEMTWFCFQPDRAGRPCGRCSPCNDAIAEGMGHRIPWQGYARRYLYKATRPALPILRAARSRLKP